MKPPKKKRDTGVAAARSDYPTSTNVSSPVQAASRRRLKQVHKAEPATELHKIGYPRDDGFVASDGDDDDINDTEDDSDGFESINVKGKSRSVAKKGLGPPITTDEKIDRLNPIHQIVVEDFLHNAKQHSQKVSQSQH